MPLFKSREEREREKLNELVYSLSYRGDQLKREADRALKKFESMISQVERLLEEGYDENDAQVKYYSRLALQHLQSSERLYNAAATYKTAALRIKEILSTYVGAIDLNAAKNAIKRALPSLRDVEKRVLDEARSLDQLGQVLNRILEGPIQTVQELFTEATPDLTRKVIDIAKAKIRKKKEPEKVKETEVQEKVKELKRRIKEMLS